MGEDAAKTAHFLFYGTRDGHPAGHANPWEACAMKIEGGIDTELFARNGPVTFDAIWATGDDANGVSIMFHARQGGVGLELIPLASAIEPGVVAYCGASGLDQIIDSRIPDDLLRLIRGYVPKNSSWIALADMPGHTYIRQSPTWGQT